MMEEERSLNENHSARGQFVREMIIVEFSYVTDSWFGRVKLLQFLFVTLAGIITPSAIYLLFSSYAFFVFIVWTSFIYIFLDLVLHFTSLWRRLPKVLTAPAVLIFPLGLGVVVFLIGSSLIASAAHIANGSQSVTSGLGAFCGYVVMILFGIEIFLHLRTMRLDGPQAEAPAVNPARNRPISHPVSVEIDNEPPPYKATEEGHDGSTSVYVAPVNTFS